MILSLYTKKAVSRWHSCLFIAFVVLSLLLPQLAHASIDYTVKTIPNTRLTDRFSHVSNPDTILSPDAVHSINQTLHQLEDSLGIEVAVVAVKSIGENDPRDFANELFKHWGLGKKGKDNGLLILLVTDPSQRSVVFETGYGLERVLPDATCYRMQQDYMIPDMKEGDYSTGMQKGVSAVSQYLMSSEDEQIAYRNQASDDDDDDDMWGLLIFGSLFMGVIGLKSYMKRRPRLCPQCHNKTLSYQKKHTLKQPTYRTEGLAETIYRCKKCGYTCRERQTLSRLSNSDSGGGGSWGGGSSGGGGSWGGGSSGGGGAVSRF